MISPKEFLYSPEGREYLITHYSNGTMSAYDIAKYLKSYPNLVYRALVYHNIERKSKGEAQKQYLEKGGFHPTKGRQRTIEERRKIGMAMHENWKGLSEEDFQKRVELARQKWYNQPEKEREKWVKKSHAAIRKAAIEGSKCEKFIVSALRAEKYKIQVHKKWLFDDGDCHVDIFLPADFIAIEINGPAHYRPIFGDDTFKKTVERDLAKIQQLLGMGYAVIIINNEYSYYSDSCMSDLMKHLLPLIKKVAEANEPSYYEILVENPEEIFNE